MAGFFFHTETYSTLDAPINDMKILFPIIFATIAAIGNAMFAFGQKKSAGVENGLLFVGLSALVAVFLVLSFSSLGGVVDVGHTMKDNWRNLLISGVGLFLTYLGFNLLYSRYGVSQYVLYAVLSIFTTTILIGMYWLKEPINIFHKIAILMAVLGVIFFSIGQAKT
ncbi:MAG: EamA family transporter [Desulfosporosinus sp.]|nr:EamA family transporter [Desulfosporosinus sp.]